MFTGSGNEQEPPHYTPLPLPPALSLDPPYPCPTLSRHLPSPISSIKSIRAPPVYLEGGSGGECEASELLSPGVLFLMSHPVEFILHTPCFVPEIHHPREVRVLAALSHSTLLT